MDINTWLFMRVSGVLLLLALLVHLAENFFFRSSLTTPILVFVVNVCVVVFVISHGLTGLKRVIDDQGLALRGQTVLAWALVPVGLVAAYFATEAMLRFGLL